MNDTKLFRIIIGTIVKEVSSDLMKTENELINNICKVGVNLAKTFTVFK